MSKERQIRKISLNVSGLKGLIIEGTEDVAKDNKITNDAFKLTKRHPIHFELEDKIKELRFFALEICGLITDTTTKHEKSTLLEQADITSIEFEKGIDGFFKLKASSRVFDTKSQNLITPKVDGSDNYEYYDTVMNIIEAILVEVDQYVKGLKKVTDEEIMMSYVRLRKDKDMDIETVMKMDSDQRAAYIEEVSKKLGFIANVMEVDDIEDSEIEEELVTETEQPLMLGYASPDEKQVKAMSEVFEKEYSQSGELTDKEDIEFTNKMSIERDRPEVTGGLQIPEPIKLKK